jgi:hypothetical protein
MRTLLGLLAFMFVAVATGPLYVSAAQAVEHHHHQYRSAHLFSHDHFSRIYRDKDRRSLGRGRLQESRATRAQETATGCYCAGDSIAGSGHPSPRANRRAFDTKTNRATYAHRHDWWREYAFSHRAVRHFDISMEDRRRHSSHHASSLERNEVSGVLSLRTVGSPIPQPDPALLSPQPTPECEFKSVAQSDTEPREAMRMKLDYEQQCYRQAEEILRARYQRLQEAFGKTLEAIK